MSQLILPYHRLLQDDPDPTRIVVEASDIGLAPGQWPDQIIALHGPDVVARTFRQLVAEWVGPLGVQEPPTLTAVRYVSQEGDLLTVLND